MSNIKRLLPIFLVLPLIIAVYYPGLTGGFMLDDWGSLPQLFDTIATYGFWYAIFDGETGPTGRPLPLLTFALQHEAWPANPLPFKTVNLAIHILNTLLIGILCRRLAAKLDFLSNQHRFYFSLGVTLLWACTPIQISTVLYVVQRMVLLSAFFTLLGIVGYLKGRDILITKNKITGYLWMFASLACFGSLAVFSKENGLLLVLFILALELTLLKDRPDNNFMFRGWKFFFLVGPFLAFLGYLLINLQGRVLSGYEWRLFSFEERLLTQPRILWDYIRLILFPQGSALGLFHEDYEFSKSLFQPWTTLLAIVGIVSSVFVAVIYRKKLPVIAFATTWFLFGHTMESTIIPLELYFEHRNYLPSLSIIFGFCYFVFWLYSKITNKFLRASYFALLSLYCSLVLGITYSQSSMWGNELEFAVVQANEHPRSIRARTLMIDAFIRLGDINRASLEANRISNDFPRNSTLALIDMDFACRDENYPPLSFDNVKERLRNSNFGYAVLKSIDNVIGLKAKNKCPGVSTDYIKKAIATLMANPNFKRRKNFLPSSLALIYLQENDIQAAIDTLKPLKGKNYDQRLLLVQLLATKGYYEEALTEIEGVKRLVSFGLNSRSKQKVINDLEKVVVADLKASEIIEDIANRKKNL
ncbi:MAG: hypothetical protein V3U75_08460 [Methylococcaceae bacterium]